MTMLQIFLGAIGTLLTRTRQQNGYGQVNGTCQSQMVSYVSINGSLYTVLGFVFSFLS